MVRKLHYLKVEITAALCDIDAEQTSLRSTLELLMMDMNKTLSNFQILHEDLLMKLNNLNDIDALLKLWQQNIENMLSKLSSVIDDYERSFTAVKLEMGSSSIPLHTSQNQILEIIRNNRNERWPVLSYYFGKVQIFCDSSFKILAEIMHQLDVIQSSYKAELKAMGAALCSSSQAFKKFISDISTDVKLFQQNFEEQEKELLQMTDMICFHHKFKKQFDEKVSAIKQSLLDLKQMCLEHSKASANKWNEIEKDCHKTLQKHIDISEHLSTIHKDMSKYVDNFAQQKLSSPEYPPLKDKTDNVESRTHQLLQIHKDMKGDIGEAFEVHKKGIDKEVFEVKEYINSQKAEIEKYFDTTSFKLKTTSKSFHDKLRSMQQNFSVNKDEPIKKLDSLLSSVFSLATIYDNYKSVSSNILEKSERSFKIMPPVCEIKNDMPDESFILDTSWKVEHTSTPNIPETKELDVPYEKEKLLCRIKSVIERQVSQKLSISDLDSEERENKNYNVSTMSLPNLSTRPKVPTMSGKNLSKSKLAKK